MANSKKEINILLKADMDIGNAAKEADKLKQVFNKISLPVDNQSKINKLFNNLNSEIEKYQSKLKSGFKTKTDVTGLENTGKNINRIFEQINSEFKRVQKMDLGEIFKIDPKVQEEINKINQEIKEYKKSLSELGKKNNLPDLMNFQNQLKTKGAKDNSKKVFDLIDEGEYQKALELIRKLQNEQERYKKQFEGQGKNTANVKANEEAFNELGNSVEKVIAKAEELNQKINNAEAQKTDKIAQEFTNVQTSINGAADGFDRLTNETKGYISVGNAAANETQQLNKELNDIQNKVAYFFSLSNSVNLLKRTIRSAYNTVKELDAAMTETAVVTDFSVGDMWDQLPRYTKAANELGTTTLGAYQTMTLFYQQGLKTNEVFEIGTETMKMARIAGMEYADATNKMTAALRGFNMELNETSAQRVNDVYSELAAITAADTNEIATAMTKTASIADSANMEFETTAAFLSQIIETTRESAETAGTAMKTVIARFQELKKDPAEIGEVDGEIVDANKIETALRTINVALRDTSGQFRDLDDVFLEIASKWDTLDTNTQRYIATMAAGSRQQSRFIAMMSNYDRTMELVNAANNSAGASQRQFEKTTESLESKLNKLKNAWDAFTMGLTNSTIIKVGVDLLTTFLTTVNKLIDGLSGENGLIKSILSLGMAFGGLKIGKNLLTGLSSDIAKVFKNVGKEGVSAWNDGLKAGFKSSGENIQKTVKNIFNKDLWADFFKGFNDDFKNEISAIQSSLDKVEIQKGDAENNLRRLEEFNALSLQSEAIQERLNKFKEASIIQQNAYNAAIRSGIPAFEAEKLLSAENAEQKLKEALARKMNKEAIDDEVEALFKKKLAEVSGSEFSKLPLLDKAKDIGKSLFAIGKEARGSTTLIKTLGDSGNTALKRLGTAMTALPLGWVAAGLVAVGIAAYAIWKSSPAQQLKEAQEAAEQAANAADSLAEKYNNLKISLDEIGEKRKNLDELTKGTQEWKDAVFELNQQVLQLMKDFPELASFVENTDGVLTIDYSKTIGGKTAEDIINSVYEQQIRASAASIGADLNVNQKQEALIISDFEKNATFTTNLEDSVVKDIALMFAKGEILGTTENREKDAQIISEYLDKINYEDINLSNQQIVDELLNNTDNLREIGKELHGISEQTKAYYSSLNAQASLISNLEEKGYKKDVETAASDYSLFITEDILSTPREDRTFAENSRKEDKKLIEEYAKMMGYDYDHLNWFGGKAVLRDAEGNKIKVRRKDIEKQLNAAEAAERLGVEQENFAKSLMTSSESIQKFVKASTTQNSLTQLSLEQFLSSDLAATLGDKAEEYYNKLYEEQKEQFDKANEILFGNGEDKKGILGGEAKDPNDASLIENKIGAEALSGLANNLYDVLVTQGRQAAVNLYDQINSFANEMEMDSDSANAFVAALNSIDWSSEASIESFKTKLKDFGLSFPEEEIDSFILQMKETSKAVDKLNVEQLKEKLLSLKDVIDNVTSKIEDDINKFTQEELDSLIETGAVDRNDFFATGIDEFVYLGTTESLLGLIDNKVGSILKIQKETLEKSIDEGSSVKEFMESDWSYIEQDTNTEDGIINIYAPIDGEQFLTKLYYNKDFANSIDLTTLKDAAVKSGAISENEIGNYGQEEILSRLRYFFEQYLALDSNKAVLEGIVQDEEQISNFEKRSHQFVTSEKVLSKEKNEKEFENSRIALEAQARAYGVSESVIQKFNRALEDNGGILNDTTEAIIANAVEDKKAEKALSKLTGEVSEITEEYEDLKDITDEDVIKIGEAFGLEELDVGSESFNFIKDNLVDIADAVTGDIEAFSRLQDKLAEYYGLEISADGNFIELEGNLDTLSEKTQDLVNKLIEAGLFEIEYVKVSQGQEYLSPIYKDGQLVGSEIKYANVEGWATVIKPISAPSIKNATGNKSGTSTRKSSSGGSSKSWENPYDKFYNLTETINKNLREREKLERTYNKLLREQQHILNTIDYEKNLSDQISNLKQQADKLRREYALQSTMYSGKGNELQSYMAKNSSMRKYGYYDAASQQIVIDWNAINKVKDDEKGQKIEDYIGKLEELRDAMWDAEDAMLDAEEQIEEMKEDLREKLEELKQTYLDFEDRIVEALVAQRQAEIDELQEVYDLMSESNNSVLSAIQEVISEQRRLRELEEQKADIEEMQRRLAMLRQDTSGASDLEIKALEEQIGDAQQSYTDSLIDQAIDEMGTANEKAEEQRQQQIDLLQHQLDWDKENGKFWAQVNELLSTAINPDGSLNNNSPLVELLKSTEGYKAMSEFGKQNWWINLQKTVAEAMSGLKEWLNPTDVDATIGGAQGGDAGIVGGVGSDDGGSGGSGGSGGGSGVLARGENVKTLQRFLKNHWGKNIEDDGVYGSKTKKAVKEVQKTLNDAGAVAGGRIQEDGLYGADTQNAIRIFYSRTGRSNIAIPAPMFKTGGLADFTGPAWLDGTKTHPEIVLNARDTANFLELRDILRDMNLVSEGKTSGGDNYFEIHIEVDTLSNDYDVEQVADKVKRIINDDARYRNTNAINLIR